MIQKSSLLSDHCLKIPAQTHDTRRGFSSCPSDHSLLPHFFSSWRSPRTFGVEGDEGDVVADALAAHLAAVGHGVAGLGAALAVLVVAVVVAGHLHHDGVLPAPGHRAAGKERGSPRGNNPPAGMQAWNIHTPGLSSSTHGPARCYEGMKSTDP